MTFRKIYFFGWHRDLPDIRDFTDDSTEIRDILNKSHALKKIQKDLPKSIDLSPDFSPIENQLDIGSCTAQAGVGLMEYYQKKAFKNYLDGSRLFLYKTTRNLLGFTGDDGAYLRSTMKAMALFGICPEQYWPYNTVDFNKEPPAFCYALAQNYQALRYYRLDPASKSPNDILQSVKEKVAAKLPAMFGFVVYSSCPMSPGKPDIPFPKPSEKVLGGHAIIAVGYDDTRKIGAHTGALKIRNSWGKEWGDNGYGWLPYEYILKGLAVDFWSLVKAEFVKTDLFEE